eukprot:8547917-Prorocentrum_lima.AAC.1
MVALTLVVRPRFFSGGLSEEQFRGSEEYRRNDRLDLQLQLAQQRQDAHAQLLLDLLVDKDDSRKQMQQ